MRYLGAFCAASGVTAASAAHAHAPVEITQVVSSRPDDIVLATNRGIVIGQLEPRAFALLCAEALEVGVTQSYRLLEVASGRLLLASSAGLSESVDRGCTWSASTSLATVAVADMVRHPTDVSTVFVATTGDGASALQVSEDDGATFRVLLSLADDESVRSLLVSASSSVELYASAYSGPSVAPTGHFVLHSSDGGVHWERLPLVLEEGERDLTLLAVSGARPSDLLARASARRPELGERALLSRDAGRTFVEVAKLRLLRSASFASTGGEVYLGGVDGVFRAAQATLPFEHVGESAWVSDVQARDDAVVVGGFYDGIDVPRNGVGLLAENTFTPWFSFAEVTDVVQCSAPSVVTSKCLAPLRDFRLENGGLEIPRAPSTPQADGGVVPSFMESDAGASVLPAPTDPLPSVRFDVGLDGGPTDDRSSESLDDEAADSTPPQTGCAVQSTRTPDASWLLSTIAWFGWRRRRTSRAR